MGYNSYEGTPDWVLWSKWAIPFPLICIRWMERVNKQSTYSTSRKSGSSCKKWFHQNRQNIPKLVFKIPFTGLISWANFGLISWANFGLISLAWFLGHTLAWYTVISWKRAHGWGTLQVCQRGGWALFRLFLHLTTKEHPRHVYSDSKPSKQIIGHIIMYNEITSGFEVEFWRHTTLWTAWCKGENSVACGAHHISYVLLRKDALY